MNKLNEDFYKAVSEKVVKKYYACMRDFLVSYQGKITEAEAIVNIINISLTVGVNIYFSLKDFLPFAQFNNELLSESLIERMRAALLEFNNHKDVSNDKEKSLPESA